VQAESGESILVAGPLWIDAAAPTTTSAQASQVGALARRLGLDESHLGPDTAEEVLLTDGDRVEVQGESRREHVARAGYRGGEMLVLRGRSGAPLLLTRR